MIASVLVMYTAKSLDRNFDYLIPDNLKGELKVGHKVLVPFGSQIVEGFVIDIKSEIDSSYEYKEIIEIVEKEFCLNEELLNLGNMVSEKTLSTKMSAYQAMFPKALKARSENTVGIKTKAVVYVNPDINVNEYIVNNSRNKKEVSLLTLIGKNEVDRSTINSDSLRNLIKKGIVLVKNVEVKRMPSYIKEEENSVVLTPEQQKCYEEIKNSDNDKVLLYGVTGSGKTEIYIKLIKDALKEGKTALMLVPEISLTPQIVNRFLSIFKGDVAAFHSALSEGEKYDEYRRIASGEVKIVVGARSAIFSPLKNIGVIIVDECSSPSFKQDVNPKYNAIDVAFWRGKTHNAKVIMGSATPSLEQFARGIKGVYKLVKLTKRVSENLPKYILVDMNEQIKKRNFVLSDVLKEKITKEVNNGHQVIILLNRRGYSTFLSCSSCGFVWKCPKCDISLIYHKSSGNLSCHYCGYMTKMTKMCPNCHEEAIKDLGMGTEKLEEIFNKEFPSFRTVRMDLDTTRNKGSHGKIIEDFKNNKYDILIGTQMISKGLNFKNVTLVGVINADTSLNIPDFRSSERTFELLSQTGGRTGRYDLDGEVVIQTYNTDNYTLNCVCANDYEMFYNKEMPIRKVLKYPPYYYLVSLKIISEKYEIAKEEAVKIKNYLSINLNDSFIILGPSVASLVKLKNKYYFQIIIKYRNEFNLFETLKVINDMYTTKKVQVDININPLNML